MSYEDKTEEWQRRMREVQGAIVVASVFQLVLGYFGKKLASGLRMIINSNDFY